MSLIRYPYDSHWAVSMCSNSPCAFCFNTRRCDYVWRTHEPDIPARYRIQICKYFDGCLWVSIVFLYKFYSAHNARIHLVHTYVIYVSRVCCWCRTATQSYSRASLPYDSRVRSNKYTTDNWQRYNTIQVNTEKKYKKKTTNNNNKQRWTRLDCLAYTHPLNITFSQSVERYFLCQPFS